MIQYLNVTLSEEQRAALLTTKLFNSTSPMSIRGADGVEANSTASPALVERGRCQQIRGKKAVRLHFVRSYMDGWADLLITQEDKTKIWHDSKPIEFVADFGLVGKINAAHEVLLCLQESGVEEVRVGIAGFNAENGAATETYRLMGFNPDACWLSGVPETIPVETLLKLCVDLKQRQKRLSHTGYENLTLDKHLVGMINVYP